MSDDDKSEDVGGFDPGPAFVPGAASDAAPIDEAPSEPPKLLTVPEMKKMLLEASKVANEHLGETTKSDLRMTELEASLIAPGLVRYANRRPAVLATFTGADYLKLAVGSFMYTGRNLRERRDAIAAELAADRAGERPADGFTVSSEQAVSLVPLEPGGDL